MCVNWSEKDKSVSSDTCDFSQKVSEVRDNDDANNDIIVNPNCESDKHDNSFKSAESCFSNDENQNDSVVLNSEIGASSISSLENSAVLRSSSRIPQPKQINDYELYRVSENNAPFCCSFCSW